MKSKLLFFIFVTASFSTIASSKFSAEQVCAKNKTEIYKEDCFYTVDKAWYFDEAAVKVCQSLTYDPFRNDCLFLVADKKFEANSLKECAKITSLNAIINDTNTLDCIFEAPRKYFMAR